jgi:hypothetical protein
VKRQLFAGFYALDTDGPELVAIRLEQFDQSPEPDLACEVATILVEAARSGDSDAFRQLANWVDSAHGVKPKGRAIDNYAVDRLIRDLIYLYEDREPPVRLTGQDAHDWLRDFHNPVSLRYARGRLRAVEKKIKEERAKGAAKTS